MKRIPAARYTSAAYMAAEWERLWTRVWLLVAHRSQLARPGDYLTVEVGRESLLLARGEDGRVACFFNVCPHRGNRLCTAHRGHGGPLRCSYHHWAFELDGRLREAPRAGAGIVTEECRLSPVRCEERLGFVFVCLDAGAMPLDDYLGEAAPLIAAYRPEEMALAGDTTVEVACNWKTSSDVNNEAYHLRSLHAEMMQVVDDTAITVGRIGRHGRITIPLGRAAPGTVHAGSVPPLLRGLLEREGVPDFRGGVDEVRPALRRAVREGALRDGIDLSPLTDDQLVDKHQLYLFPNVQLNFTARSLELYRHRPHPRDPERCYFDEQRFDRVAPGTAREPAPRRAFRHGEQPLGPVMAADVDLLPSLQAGLRSSGFPGLLLTEQEDAITHMHEELDRWLGGAGE